MSKADSPAAPRVYTQKEIAKALGLCPETISRLTTQKIIPCYRIGRILRYDLNAVLSAMAQPATLKKK